MEFFKHPKKVCMSYKEHMFLSLGFSAELFIGSIKALVHAIYPDAYITSTSDVIKSIDQKIKESGCKK